MTMNATEKDCWREKKTNKHTKPDPNVHYMSLV